jgi:hypothetical protein
MVISDSAALREYFQDSALYTKHNPKDIADRVINAIENKEKLIQEGIQVKKLRNEEFKTLIKKLQSF